jgi:thiol-disulfide isomerase/thioredoxin
MARSGRNGPQAARAEAPRAEAARARIAAQQAAARRAEIRRRTFIAGGAVVVVLAIVLALVVVKLRSGTSSAGSGPVTGTALPASVIRDVARVPASTLAAVGAGSVPSTVRTPVTAISGTPLTAGGKPEVLYIGAEFCPYCAAMRWSMAVALSRFGTLSPLRGIHSSSTDAYPHTATLTFYKSSYQSSYLAFTPVENETIDHAPLQSTTPAQQRIWNKYDPDNYPFIDVGNKYMIGVIYNPQVLHGKTWSQIAAALRNPSSPVAQGADGAANYLTAAICKVTSESPASVCASPAIAALQGKL